MSIDIGTAKKALEILDHQVRFIKDQEKADHHSGSVETWSLSGY